MKIMRPAKAQKKRNAARPCKSLRTSALYRRKFIQGIEWLSKTMSSIILDSIYK